MIADLLDSFEYNPNKKRKSAKYEILKNKKPYFIRLSLVFKLLRTGI